MVNKALWASSVMSLHNGLPVLADLWKKLRGQKGAVTLYHQGTSSCPSNLPNTVGNSFIDTPVGQ
eukprot:4101355-Amphidinium_carterae.1